MKCPFCNHHDNKVMDKRESDDLTTTKRRRECLKCSKRFTTFERVELADLIVIKKNNRREQFSRDKLKRGLGIPCEKRPISQEQIERILDEIEAEIRKKKLTEVKSSEIGHLVMKKLKKLDKVAYIRFASVYRDFADLETFQEELQALLKKK
jgi:transcriptional repressor NrdR